MSDLANDPERAVLDPGSRVEVRTGFDRSWAAGFEIEAAGEDGYRVRRQSDGQILPATFAATEVRKEKGDQMWWY